MTSQTIEIHQRSVLQIIKTCFNIYLTSRSKINEATAQGCLSQMLNGIFTKMEQKMVKNFSLIARKTHPVSHFRYYWMNIDNNMNRTQRLIQLQMIKKIFSPVNTFSWSSTWDFRDLLLVTKEIPHQLVEKICYGKTRYAYIGENNVLMLNRRGYSNAKYAAIDQRYYRRYEINTRWNRQWINKKWFR